MKASITGTGSYLPETKLTNADMTELVETSDDWITERTGISERRISSGESTWSMALEASLRALDDAGMTSDEIDLIIAATVTPDYYTPSLACILQGKLGAAKAFAFDINAACSGFIYGLDIARRYIEADGAKNVLLVCSETLSKITDYNDRNTCVLFGDAAGAVVVSAASKEGIIQTHLASDGTGAHLLAAKALPVVNPLSPDPGRDILDSRADRFISMDGKEVYKFAVKAMPEAMDKVMAAHGISAADLAYIIPHQANARIIDSVVEKYGLDPAKVVKTLGMYGNTSSASIPVALDELNRKGALNPGDLLVAVGFGAGLTYGAALIRWQEGRKC